MTDPDPRTELAALAAALAGHARRSEWHGRRTVPRPATEDPGTLVPQPPPERRSAGAASAAAPAAEKTAAPAAAPSTAPLLPDVGADAPPTAAVAEACETLDELRAAVAGCRACALCETRTQTVFADGSPSARVLFVGEAPGADEDARGVPFVGRAGKLLTDIVHKGMGLVRERDVYIANVLKCRPPGNRDPEPEEKRLCTPFLKRQIELVDPEVVVPLGRHAAQHLLASDAPMGGLRGRVHRVGGRAVVPTYHPAYLLRSPGQKRATWEDVQLAMRELGLPVPPATEGGGGSGGGERGGADAPRGDARSRGSRPPPQG